MSQETNSEQHAADLAQEMGTPVQQPAPQPKKKNYTIRWVILIVVLLLICGGGYAILSYQKANSQEQLMYNTLENNDNPQDYLDFLEQFPQSEYVPEVKKRLAKLEDMLDRWKQIAMSDNVKDFINFKSDYADSKYVRLCEVKIDSLDFVTAQREGTPEAFARYVSLHPDGRYASEASIAEGTLRDQEITPEDRDQIMTLLNNFFEGFGTCDEMKITTNITSTMSRFLSKEDANKVVVMQTIKGMFNEHILSCQFIINRDINITCTKEGADRTYSATFTVDQHIERDNDGKTFGQYNCTATITPQLLISSLTMSEMSRDKTSSSQSN